MNQYVRGSIIEMGRYPFTADGKPAAIRWRVLYVGKMQSLLISEFGIDCLPYFAAPPKALQRQGTHEEWQSYTDELKSKRSPLVYDENGNEYTDVYGTPITDWGYRGFPLNYPVVWAASTIRNLLNGEFLSECFTPEEAERIVLSEVKNGPSPICQYQEGGPDTSDRIFLLDFNAAKHWFPLAVERRCAATPYALKRAAAAGISVKSAFGPWWLRTVGIWEKHSPTGKFDGDDAEYPLKPRNNHCVVDVDNDGVISLYGMSAETSRLIRPAMLVKNP